MKKFHRVLTFTVLTATFLAGLYLFVGCKKNVGVITNVVKYDISGLVTDNQSVAVSGAAISVNGTAVATSDASGKYTIPKNLPGTYLIEASKTGFTKGQFSATVTTSGVATKVIILKPLAAAVSVPVTGGTVTGTNTAGKAAATLTIPAGTLTAPVQISVTFLAANEAPTVPAALIPNSVPGVIVQFDCSNPAITFPNGITLSFNLPYTQKPGSAVKVLSYNETTKVWDSYPNAIVGADGNTASLLIYHFSQWAVEVGATFTQTDVSADTPVVVPYTSPITWQSTLDFKTSVLNGIDPVFLYGFVKESTNLDFSYYLVSGVSTTIGSGTQRNNLTISAASITNPDGFGDLNYRPWELVKYSYLEKGTVSYQVYNSQSGQTVTVSVDCWYTMPSYVWLWRPDAINYSIPVPSGFAHTDAAKVEQIILGQQHHGGAGQ